MQFVVLLALLPAVQGQPCTNRVDVLIEKLGADEIAERDEATRTLLGMGKEVLPELRKAFHHPDAEVVARAMTLVYRIGPFDRLTPNLLKALPGVEDRLFPDDFHSWCLVFIEAVSIKTIKAADVEPFAVRALEGARTSDERKVILTAVADRGLRSAIPAVVPLLMDESCTVGRHAAITLGELRAREAVPVLASLLRHGSYTEQRHAAYALYKLGPDAEDAVPALIDALDTPSGCFKGAIIRTLGGIGPGAKEAVPVFTRMLRDERYWVRAASASALGNIGAPAQTAVPLLREALKDEKSSVQSSAAEAIKKIEAAGKPQ